MVMKASKIFQAYPFTVWLCGQSPQSLIASQVTRVILLHPPDFIRRYGLARSWADILDGILNLTKDDPGRIRSCLLVRFRSVLSGLNDYLHQLHRPLV